jgi:putative membrane protein
MNEHPITSDEQRRNQTTMWLINIVSIAVPIVVAVLLGIRTKVDLGAWTKILPHVIGGINSLTSILLVIGFLAIRQRKIAVHRACMSSAIVLGALFLVCYVTYHLSNPSTSFGGVGTIRYVYYFVLLSHILLSLVVLPLVLRAFAYAWCGMFELHRRIARFAFPIWLYVSLSGVIAYLMISPYYVK